jgi:hypothetical protein
MERKKVLIIGMFDSIHMARWLSQFEDQNIEFILFPSKKFKYLNFELLKLIKSKNIALFSFARPYFYFKYIGYLDYFLNSLFTIVKIDFKKEILKIVLKNNKFEFVHAIEIQGAGYLYSTLPKNILGQNSLILTNYGSDIFYFKNFTEHEIKIRSVLKIAKYYSGECHRDYELALSLNFNGQFLPCIPNAGGFKNNVFELNSTLCEDRNLIIAKCYGGTFGLGKLIIEALSTFLLDRPNVKVILYSITDDLIEQATKLSLDFSEQITLYFVRDKIKREIFLKYFSVAKIYIGASKSDGISTSFLEALCLGAFPIQTNTSCGNEWLDLGFIANLVDPDVQSIKKGLIIYDDDDQLEKNRISNLIISKKILNYSSIKTQALKFYGLTS